MLRWRARRRPNFPATWYKGKERTFDEMNRTSSELAAGLVEGLGIEPGDRVAILDKNSDDYMELLFALDKAGALACPINWRLTAPEVAAVVGDADPKALVVSDDLRQNADQVTCRVVGYADLPRVKGGADPHRDAEENITWQLYTSCTTGIPKGAMLTNLNLFALSGALPMEIKGFDEYGRSLVAMPLYHIGGCGWALGVIGAGCTAVLVRDFITQVYGLTETTGAVTFLQQEDHVGERFLSCGRSGFGHDLRVVGPDGKDVPAGEIGEIVYRGPGTMAGYWRKEGETKEAIRDGWFHTGDAGTMDAEGFIYIKDRIKDMIISGGENIYPAEVEAILAAHPNVADVAVIGVPDDTWGEAVKAIVIKKPNASLTADELIDWSKDKLAGFKRPRSIDFVEVIPRNPTGKILKKDLRAPYWVGHERAVH